MVEEAITSYIANCLLCKFNPRTMDFLIWQNSFDYIFELSKVENRHKGKFLLHMLEPCVLTTLKKLCAPFDPDEISYNMLVSTLERTYTEYQGIGAIDYRFTYRNQLPKEPVEHFAYALKELFNRTSFSVRYTNELKDRFIDGLIDKKIKTLLKTKKSLSFAMAISIAKEMELAKKNQSEESSSK